MIEVEVLNQIAAKIDDLATRGADIRGIFDYDGKKTVWKKYPA